MKKTILPLLILISVSAARASDTLTVGQVFNFNVGDTFDYRATVVQYTGSNDTLTSDLLRYVIISKTISLTGDSVTYVRQQIYPTSDTETHIYTNLDSSILEYFDTIGDIPYLTFDTSSLPNGTFINTISVDNPGIQYYTSISYAAGLGQTFVEANINDETVPVSINFDTTLIYYSSSGARTYGQPYYMQPDYASPHYTPIPEQCASWIRRHYEVNPNGPPIDSFDEQIKTGNKIFANNHVYVELYCTSYYYTSHFFQPDSLIGYFRNDTPGQKVYFTNSLISNDTLLYDFSLRGGMPLDIELHYIFNKSLDVELTDQTLAGINRRVWNYYEYYGTLISGYSGQSAYAEGIGDLGGFVYVNNNFPGADIYSDDLISFCVCGQSLYPNADSSNCFDVTDGVNNLKQNIISVYPNPATGTLHLYISQPDRGCQLVLTDLPGSELLSQPISQTETTIDISHLASGIYIWRLTAADGMVRTGKVVKE